MSCALPSCGGLLYSLRSLFSTVKLSSVSRCLCSRQRLWARLLAALETAPLDAYDFQRFLERKAYVFEGDRIVKKLGAAVTRRLALCPPVVIQLRQRRLKWLRRQLVWEQSTGHPSPPLAALFGTFSWGDLSVKTDGTLSPTAPRLLVIIADDLEAVGLPLTSPTSGTRPMDHAE